MGDQPGAVSLPPAMVAQKKEAERVIQPSKEQTVATTIALSLKPGLRTASDATNTDQGPWVGLTSSAVHVADPGPKD